MLEYRFIFKVWFDVIVMDEEAGLVIIASKEELNKVGLAQGKCSEKSYDSTHLISNNTERTRRCALSDGYNVAALCDRGEGVFPDTRLEYFYEEMPLDE